MGAQEKSDWSADKYFDAGKDTAAAIELLVPFTSNEVEVGIDILGIPEFAAGFFYGMVGDNHLTEFQTCFQSSSELVHYAESFISELEDLKIIAAIEQWAAIFKEPEQLVEKLGKHWLLHQKAIMK